MGITRQETNYLTANAHWFNSIDVSKEYRFANNKCDAEHEKMIFGLCVMRPLSFVRCIHKRPRIRFNFFWGYKGSPNLGQVSKGYGHSKGHILLKICSFNAIPCKTLKIGLQDRRQSWRADLTKRSFMSSQNLIFLETVKFFESEIQCRFFLK